MIQLHNLSHISTWYTASVCPYIPLLVSVGECFLTLYSVLIDVFLLECPLGSEVVTSLMSA